MDFLVNVLIYGFAFLGLLTLIGSVSAAVVLAYQERYGRPPSDSFEDVFSAADRLHGEAQRAIRDLEDLANRGDR